MVGRVLVEEGEPSAQVVEGLLARNFEDEESAVGVAQVGGDQAFVLFLSGSVPELQAVGFVCVAAVVLAKTTFLLRKSMPTVGWVLREVPGSGGRSRR